MSVKIERETTTNYGLVKPKQTDFYNVDDFNINMDKIDGQLKISANQIKNLEVQLGNLDTSWEGITGKPKEFPPSKHKHAKVEITDFPISLPANGGNADTVDGLHASDFMNYVNVSNNTDPNKLMPTTSTTPIICRGTFLLSSLPSSLTDGQGFIVVYPYSAGSDASKGWARQEFISAHNMSVKWVRYAVGGAYGAWKRDDDFAPNYKSGNGYYGIVNADGTDSSWLRTTSLGLLPYATGGTTSSLGTSAWKFKEIHGVNIFANGVNVGTEITDLKSSVSSGKNGIASAITSKGVPATGSDTHATLANKIGQINSVTAVRSSSTTSTMTIGGALSGHVSGMPNVLSIYRFCKMIIQITTTGTALVSVQGADNSTVVFEQTIGAGSHSLVYCFNSTNRPYTGSSSGGFRIQNRHTSDINVSYTFHYSYVNLDSIL